MADALEIAVKHELKMRAEKTRREELTMWCALLDRASARATARNQAPGKRQAIRCEQAKSRAREREREGRREAQSRLIVPQISLNLPRRDAEKRARNRECGSRDGVRIVQPCADRNVGCRKRVHCLSRS